MQKSSKSKLRDIKLRTTTPSNIAVYDAKFTGKYQFVSEVELEETVFVYTSILGRNHILINEGDYLSYRQNGEVSKSIVTIFLM